MVTNTEMNLILGGDSIMYTCMQIANEIARQGYSKFKCAQEYDFHRLYEQFDDDGYEIEADLENLSMNIKPKDDNRQS